MAVFSSSISLRNARKPITLVLILALTALLVNYAAAATGGAMGGGFSTGGRSGGSSSSYRSGNNYARHHYTTLSGSRTYVFRDSCSHSGDNCKPKTENESVIKDSMDSFFYPFLAFFLVSMVIVGFLLFYHQTLPMKSVVKLQVALKGTASCLQEDLNHIARQANTATNEGYKYVLEESAKALLRHSEFWLSSFLSEKMRNADEAERSFNEISFEERSKFDKETLINVDNHQEERKNDWETVSISANPFIVVNIIVATTGQLNLPPICSVSDLNAVLMKLGGLTKREIMAVHVLWTPQDENDHLSPERLQQDYPLLMELRTKLD